MSNLTNWWNDELEDSEDSDPAYIRQSEVHVRTFSTFQRTSATRTLI
jgi:hypothetical protein